MTEQDGYREFMSDWQTLNPDDDIDSFSARVAWDAACKWQREQIQSYLISDNQGYFIGSSQYDEVFDK